MARWAPDSQGRLKSAALELFASRGYSEVTVEEVSQAAGVTERTFYRHFPTKQDVLFGDDAQIVEDLLAAMRVQPKSAPPVELLRAALHRFAGSLEADRGLHRSRAAVIQSVAELQERELLKQRRVALALVDELRRRRMSREQATALAGVGMVVFQVAYASWVSDRSSTTLATRIERVLAGLSADLSQVPASAAG
jgi:AcrR family transcriptional regulator